MWDRLLGFTGGAGALLLLAMPFLIGWGVFRRYVLSSPVLYVEEYSGYLLVAVTFLGLAYTLRSGGHISVDILVSRLHPRVTQMLRVATPIAALAFLGVLTWSSWRLVREGYLLGTTSISVYRTPLYPIYAIMALGFTLIGIQAVIEIAKAFRSK